MTHKSFLYNTTTCVCLTNSLPITPDKSIGFYRKWLIVDFPNQFSEIEKRLIEKIPEIEFNNLAKKSLRVLKELYNTQKFTNEGSYDERAKRYEERSNPVMRFVENFCEEKEETITTLREFTNKCNEYMKLKHLRILTSKQVGKILVDEGFVIGPRKINDVSHRVILNLRILKGITTETTETTQISTSSPPVEPSGYNRSNRSNRSNQRE